MTRNLKIFGGAALIFYVIGAINDSVGMYVLAAASLAVILAAYFLTRLQIRGVQADIDLHHHRGRAGETVPALITVRNAGMITRTGMTVALKVENETVPGGSRQYEFLLPALAPSSRTEMETLLDCPHRGAHRIRNATVYAHDPIGIYHRRAEMPVSAGFLAVPRSHPAEGVSGWELLSPEGRRAARMLQRSGGELQSIRPHTPGDDLKHVHWKVTAHAGELVVKEYRRRREAEITIWLDLWDHNHRWVEDTETAISLAATLLDLFVRGDYLVSLAGQGLPRDLAMPSRGESYLDRCLVELAQVRPVPGMSFSEFCEEQLRTCPRLRNLFVITPRPEPGLEEALTAARHRGAHVVAFLAGEDCEAPVAELLGDGGLEGEDQPTKPWWRLLLDFLGFDEYPDPDMGKPLRTGIHVIDRFLEWVGLSWPDDDSEEDPTLEYSDSDDDPALRRLQAVGVSAARVTGFETIPEAFGEVASQTAQGVTTS